MQILSRHCSSCEELWIVIIICVGEVSGYETSDFNFPMSGPCKDSAYNTLKNVLLCVHSSLFPSVLQVVPSLSNCLLSSQILFSMQSSHEVFFHISSLNHWMAYVGGDLKDHLFPTSPLRTGLPTTRSGTKSGCPGPQEGTQDPSLSEAWDHWGLSLRARPESQPSKLNTKQGIQIVRIEKAHVAELPHSLWALQKCKVHILQQWWSEANSTQICYTKAMQAPTPHSLGWETEQCCVRVFKIK